jgi:hypothetical protein
MVTATGQNRPSSTVIPTVMPIVTPTITPTVALTITLIALLDLIMLVKRPLKHSFIRIKTIY